MTVSDLSPDALARLEAKLVADLELVRKVRALLEEHVMAATAADTEVAPPAAPPAPAPAGIETAPAKPVRSMEEVLMGCLAEMADQPFAPQDLRDRIRVVIGQPPNANTVKVFLGRMIRQGKVAVHEFRKGRAGCLYRSLLPPLAPAETPGKAADPAVLS